MKRLNGFSLAEVLISVAIVGVLASLTLPNLNKNIAKNQIPPALAKAINTLENANRLMLQQNDSRNLAQLCLGDADTNGEGSDAIDYLACLKSGGVINLAEVSGVKVYSTFNGEQNIDTQCYVGNDGIAYCTSGMYGQSPNTKLSAKYDGRFAIIYIDTNGVAKGASTIGKDAFKVKIDYKGSVIPVGSMIYKDYIGMEDVPTWQETCNAEGVSGNGDSCTGSIVDNSFKVIYPY